MNDERQNRSRQYDICQRYQLLALILEAAFPDGPVRVLDVGAGSDDLSRAWLPDRFAIALADTSTFGRDDITLLNPGAALPFADRAFDAVLAMDVLEHVPPPARDDLVRELARVSKSAVVMSHPTAGPEVVAAEQLLAAAHLAWFRTPSTFLDEHVQHGLPAADVATGALRNAGLHTATFANCPLVDWLPFTVLDVALLAQHGPGGPKDAFNLAANALATGLRTEGAHYRTFVVGCTDAKTLQRVVTGVANRDRPRTTADDAAIADLIARAVVQLAEVPAASSLRAALSAKDEHIRKLEVLLQQESGRSQVAIAAKDDHIRKLEALLQQREAALRGEVAAVIAAKDEHIRKLEALLRGGPVGR